MMRCISKLSIKLKVKCETTYKKYTSLPRYDTINAISEKVISNESFE